MGIDLEMPDGGGNGVDTFYRYSNRADMALDFEDFLAHHHDPGADGAYGSVFLFDDLNIGVAEKTEVGGVLRLGGTWGLFQSAIKCWGNLVGEDIMVVEWRVKAIARPTANYSVFGLYVNATHYIGIGWPATGNFRAYSEVAAGLAINIDTGVAYDNNWHRFRIVLTDALLQYYIDDALVHSSALPAQFFTDYAYLAAYFLNTVIREDVDWVYAKQTLATRDP